MTGSAHLSGLSFQHDPQYSEIPILLFMPAYSLVTTIIVVRDSILTVQKTPETQPLLNHLLGCMIKHDDGTIIHNSQLQ